MATNSAVNLKITNNADGFDVAGGTTARKLTITGADITVTGSGTNVYTYPASTDTLVGRASTDTLTNKTATGFKLTGGSTTVAPLIFNSGTNLTTAAAGAMEYDGKVPYFTSVASSRQVIDAEQFISLTATYTLASQTAAQKLFNSSTNGALTVATLTSYYFECMFNLSSMSASSGSFGFAFGGTATLTTQGWYAEAQKAALATAASGVISYNTAANTAIAQSNTNTTGFAFIKGIVRINAAGTLIPQVSLGVAAAAVIGVDSWFRIWPIGTNTVTNVGNWS